MPRMHQCYTVCLINCSYFFDVMCRPLQVPTNFRHHLYLAHKLLTAYAAAACSGNSSSCIPLTDSSVDANTYVGPKCVLDMHSSPDQPPFMSRTWTDRCTHKNTHTYIYIIICRSITKSWMVHAHCPHFTHSRSPLSNGAWMHVLSPIAAYSDKQQAVLTCMPTTGACSLLTKYPEH